MSYEEEFWDEYEEESIWDEEETCCTIPHSPDTYCPDCCPYGGIYQPAVEECEFCSWAEYCMKATAESGYYDQFEEDAE